MRRPRPPALFVGAVLLTLVILAAVLVAMGSRHPKDDPAVLEGGLRGGVARMLADMTAGGGYRRPSSRAAERFAAAYMALRRGDRERAAALASRQGFAVVRAEGRGGRWDVLLEDDAGVGDSGWGLYAHSPAATRSLAIEVPHPAADLHTELVGLELAIGAGASDLLVAGAHRSAAPEGGADVSHTPVSAFAATHEALARSGVTTVQVHGFDSERRGRSALGDVVLSSGSTRRSPLVESVADALTARGLAVCVYDGDDCRELGGTTNVQGAASRSAGAEFLHVELAWALRATAEDRARVIAALADALRGAAPP